MFLSRVFSILPGRRTLVTVLVSGVLGALVAFAVSVVVEAPKQPAPQPGPPHDPRFATLGKTYLPQLGNAYAAAWDEGAKELDAGKGIAAALDVVSQKWTSSRTQLFDHVFTPEFSRIVAESVKDADVTPAERAALAAAWRGLSLGLQQKNARE
jgi:hypothetical protein